MFKKIGILSIILFIATPLWAQLTGPVPDTDPPTLSPGPIHDPGLITPTVPGDEGMSHDSEKVLTKKEKKAVGEAKQMIREKFAEEKKVIYEDYLEECEKWRETTWEEQQSEQQEISDAYLEKFKEIVRQESAQLSDTQGRWKRRKVSKAYKKKKRKLAIERKQKMNTISKRWNGERARSKKHSVEKYRAARKKAVTNFRLNIQKKRTSEEYKTVINTHDI